MYPQFEILKENEHGRLGKLTTKHGIIETPAFIFCATKGAIKSATPEVLHRSQTQIILSNTYHLLVFPGSKKISELGKLQKMTGWNGPMMSDSGGYQIFSLGYGSVSQELKGIRNTKQTLVNITEECANFKSYRDGSMIHLTPEKAIESQIDFGADLIFCLDECTAYHIPKEQTQKSMQRSYRWANRCVEYFNDHKNDYQGLYGIIQGGVYEDLRKISVGHINDLNCFGIGIGGSLGETLKDMEDVLKMVNKDVRKDRPKHLLGIGTIDSILMGIPYGIDTFDCVYPTRLARHGGALVMPFENTRYLNLNNFSYFSSNKPIDATCGCYCCTTFSRAYLHILLKNDEHLAQILLTEHNIWFMNRFMALIRESLKNDDWQNFKNAWKIKKEKI